MILALGITSLILFATSLEDSNARSQVTVQAIPRAVATIDQAPDQTQPSPDITTGQGITAGGSAQATTTPTTPPNIWDGYTFATQTPLPSSHTAAIPASNNSSDPVATEGIPYLDLLAQYDWPLEGAIATMMCESRGQSDAVSSAGAVGLFQLHPYAEENFDPARNIANAYLKWLDGGRSFYKHWTRWGGCGAGW